MDDGQLSYRGEMFGAGTGVHIEAVEGLEGHVVRVSDAPLPRGDGSVSGQHFTDRREPMVSLTADSDAEWERVRRAFAVARAEAYQLAWRHQGSSERFVLARPAALTPEARTAVTVRRAKIGLVCADPRIYSAVEKHVTVPLYATTAAGVEDPVEDPKDQPAGTGQSEAVFTNDGNADAYPLIRWYGPESGTVTAVQLTNRTNGDAVEVATSMSVNQILTVDMQALVTGSGGRIVDLDGANRYGSWTPPRAPFRLSPGDNVLRFTLSGSSTDAVCVVAARDTSLS